MLSHAKALYQVKLILNCLPDEEYVLIPKELIYYVEENSEYDENFTLDPNKPLDEQNIDDKAYDMLNKIVKLAEENKKEKERKESEKEIKEYITKAKESNEIYDNKIELIRLKNLVETLKNENEKLPKAKDLLAEYNEALIKKDNEIEKLKRDNQNLYESIQKVPKLIRRIFIKGEDIKLLNANNNNN